MRLCHLTINKISKDTQNNIENKNVKKLNIVLDGLGSNDVDNNVFGVVIVPAIIS